jgi:hypothetical protein
MAAPATAQTPRRPLAPGAANAPPPYQQQPYQQQPYQQQQRGPGSAVQGTIALSKSQLGIENFGNQTIFFSYLKNEPNGWEKDEVGSGQTRILQCDNCVQSVKIAFDDGRSIQTQSAALGEWYAFFWDEAGRHWEFAPRAKALGALGQR